MVTYVVVPMISTGRLVISSCAWRLFQLHSLSTISVRTTAILLYSISLPSLLVLRFSPVNRTKARRRVLHISLSVRDHFLTCSRRSFLRSEICRDIRHPPPPTSSAPFSPRTSAQRSRKRRRPTRARQISLSPLCARSHQGPQLALTRSFSQCQASVQDKA